MFGGQHGHGDENAQQNELEDDAQEHRNHSVEFVENKADDGHQEDGGNEEPGGNE